MIVLSFPCFHKWSRWSDPVNGIFESRLDSVGYLAVAQMRVCDKCGVAEYRKLPKVRSIEKLKEER